MNLTLKQLLESFKTSMEHLAFYSLYQLCSRTKKAMTEKVVTGTLQHKPNLVC